MGEYILTYELWEALGYPDIDEYVSYTVGSDFVLWIDLSDTNANDIPDFLESLAGGGDVDLNPSQGVVVG